MRGTISGQKLTESLAQRLGRVGIQDELAGRERAAQTSYDAAYNLMTGPRERLGRLYDKLRGA